MTRVAAFSPARRAFLRGGVQAEPALRPPWALDEPNFLVACDGCGVCIEACPEHVLARSEGGYPVFDPMLGECLFCEACVTACIPRALDKTQAQPAWRLKAGIASTCLAKNGVTCFSCRDACGEMAIRFRPAQGGAAPELDTDRCTGCGACVGICPVSAISLARPENPHG
ncbi:ferredoxin-type protein NapF [Sphingomonas cavernae]|uniref:Ferredoxin-type protein NapF n=1 Tax=Sphingomonas cavernae TaxID=2320861 RepID=A0A418WSD1_9SPHN|nr:ferredoxin-type protein NapF [Sphingomonas cavernae]RJF94117.1 ferredoxin-type protein NapF [Sphingomonas cavernae]